LLVVRSKPDLAASCFYAARRVGGNVDHLHGVALGLRFPKKLIR
jgi:hypothetical protein